MRALKAVVRPACPSDAVSAAPLTYASGPAYFDYCFGRETALAFLEHAFRSNLGIYSHQCHVVVCVDDQVVASGVFYDGREVSRLTLESGLLFLRYFGPLPAMAVTRRTLQIAHLMPSPKAGEEYVGHLGVADEQRGRGLGTLLLSHQLDVARGKQCRTCILDVAEDNPRAQRLYERLGFRVVAQRGWGRPGNVVLPGMRRMEYVL
jgi:ribosomal protein S18 acetylase RimI-like enzyme